MTSLPPRVFTDSKVVAPAQLQQPLLTPDTTTNPTKPVNMAAKQPPTPAKSNITIIHPDLGIGGAERLIIDVALALQNTGHKVTIYTSHCDKSHCFEEARDGTLDVRVRGDKYLPANVGGRFVVLFAILRQVWLTVELLGELAAARTDKDKTDEVFIVDQVPACVPLLKTFGSSRCSARQRILFYCHFPDQLLARRDEGGSLLLSALKSVYRYPFDWFEGWAVGAADRVVANSRFTRGVVAGVFGGNRLGDVRVVYPCVDTESVEVIERSEGEGEQALWGGKKILLSVNRFERKKDLALAIRAYHGLGEEKRRGTRLVVAGMYTCLFLKDPVLMRDVGRRLRSSNRRKRPIPQRIRYSCDFARPPDGDF